MNVNLFDYSLPQELIAQAPKVPRDTSRLMVLERDGLIRHETFARIVEYIPEGALLVFNDTKVIPARLFTSKTTGGKVELLLTRGSGSRWQAIFKASRRPKEGDLLFIEGADTEPILVTSRGEGREISLKLPVNGEPWEFLERFGHIPLPPYIERPDTAEDRERYQTVYAKSPGAVAAPTAGLHFTPDILEALDRRGVRTAHLTLHVGIGTFAPVKVEDTDDHIMHEEWFHIPETLTEAIAALPPEAPVIAVGTTTLRALEGAATGPRRVTAGEGDTAIFITPGYRFQIVDALITNFHLPRSTLLMLVSALRDRDSIMAAYAEAVAQRYRFFSYGDAMFIR